jgi:hypothetical protein
MGTVSQDYSPLFIYIYTYIKIHELLYMRGPLYDYSRADVRKVLVHSKSCGRTRAVA